MRSIEVKLFKFSELSKEAKKHACEKWRNEGIEPFWTEENRKVLEAFADVFPIKVTNWSYGGRGEGVTFHFTSDDNIEELSGQRLATYIWNNYRSELFKGKYYSLWSKTEKSFKHYKEGCPVLKQRHSNILLENDCVLTGYYLDTLILAPIYNFLNKPTSDNFKDLLEDCFSEWIKVCNEDIESQQTDEYIGDHLEANEYEFTEDGERY